jgi:hypothetical protein
LETKAILPQGVGVGVGEAAVKTARAVLREDWPVAFAAREAILVLVGVATTSKIAQMEIRATERVIWSAEPRSELFCRFFIVPAAEHRVALL